jgi:hypothetical protein
VPSDAFEDGEYTEMLAKYDAEEIEMNPEIMYQMPITSAMFKDLAKIFGGPVGEDEAEIVYQILNTEIDESGLQYYTGVKKHGKEYMKKAAQAGRDGASQEELGRLKDKYSKAEKKTKEEFELEQAFEGMMGQFSESADSEVKEQKTPVTEFVLSMYDRETGQFPKGETAVLTAVEKDYGEQFINPAKAFIEAINAKYEEFNAGPAMQEIEIAAPIAEPMGTVMEPTVEQDDELNSIRSLAGI